MSWRRRTFYIVLILVGLLSLAFFVDFIWFTRQVRSYQLAALKGVELQAPRIDEEVIVVLTGDNKRIPKGMEILRTRGGGMLVISGTGKSTTLTDLVNQQGDAAVNIHEVWRKIIIESQSSSTLENAIETGKILTGKNMRRIILVTSDYHMYRSLRLFKQTLPQYEYVPYPVASSLVELTPFPTQNALVAVWRSWLEYWKLLLVRVGLTDVPILQKSSTSGSER